MGCKGANGLGNADSEPESVNAETLTLERPQGTAHPALHPGPPAMRLKSISRQKHYSSAENDYLSSINQIFYTSERYAEADMASQVCMASHPPLGKADKIINNFPLRTLRFKRAS